MTSDNVEDIATSSTNQTEPESSVTFNSNTEPVNMENTEVNLTSTIIQPSKGVCAVRALFGPQNQIEVFQIY